MSSSIVQDNQPLDSVSEHHRLSLVDGDAPTAFLPRVKQYYAALRERYGDRTVAMVLALAVELLLAIVFFSALFPGLVTPPEETAPMTTFDVAAEQKPAEDTPQPQKKAAERAVTPATHPVTPQPVQEETPKPPVEAPPPPVLLDIPLAKVPDIGSLPNRSPAQQPPARAMIGPANPGPIPGDSQRVEGRGPNGEPLYAASWFREPYDSEMRGYLSTAQAPSWALIACRTIRDYRVDNCTLLDEYPAGSQIGRAVLAAAWQFRVRPPRLRGQYQVGEWVRIRIDYGTERVRIR